MSSSSPTRLPVTLGLLLSVIAGMAMPAQGRVNGQLGDTLGDGVLAAVISFGVGLVVIIAVAALLPIGRSSVAAIPAALKQRAFPWWYMLAGAFGGYFVITQGLVVGVLGIALFTVANVLGQTMGSMVVDGTGFGPGGKRPITGLRVLSTLIMLGAVVWAVSPNLGEGGAHPASLLLPMLMPFVGGILNGLQTAMNGAQTAHYGVFIPATLFNFVAGMITLLIALGVERIWRAPTGHFPHEWWLYTGGLFGVVFISMASYLARHLGVLLTSLGMIAGQLVGSLAMDALWPVAGRGVHLATVLGSVVAIAAVALASIQPGARMPWERTRTRAR